jgi:hypothetical protein
MGALGEYDVLALRRNNAEPLIVLPWRVWARASLNTCRGERSAVARAIQQAEQRQVDAVQRILAAAGSDFQDDPIPRWGKMSTPHLLDLRSIARALGGEISGRQILAPGPGHSRGDRSLSVRIEPEAPDGFLVHPFAGDDPIICKNYIRRQLGLPEWEPSDEQDRRIDASQRARFDRTANTPASSHLARRKAQVKPTLTT